MDKARLIINQGADEIYQKLDKAITEPSNCENVDIQQLEEEALYATEHIQDLMLNIDLTNTQFSLQGLFDEAQKLGLDLEDLQEYGFDSQGLKCNQAANSCKRVDRSFDEFVDYNTGAVKKMSGLLIDKYERVSCHPMVKKHVSPVVKYFWDFMPIWNFCPMTALTLDCCLMPCCWPVWTCVQCCACPWNTCIFSCIIIPFTCVWAIVTPIVTCFACCLQVLASA